jgi:predicted RNA-binding protein with RPS1 domain
MRSKSFEYNQEHPNNEVIIKDIKQMSENGIELNEAALNNLRSDYKQHLSARTQKGPQRPQAKPGQKPTQQKPQFAANKARPTVRVQKNSNDNTPRYNSQK